MSINKKSNAINQPYNIHEVPTKKIMNSEQISFNHINSYQNIEYFERILKENSFLKSKIKYMEHKQKTHQFSKKNLKQIQTQNIHKNLQQKIMFLQKEGQIQRQKYDSLKIEYQFLKSRFRDINPVSKDDIIQHYSNMNITLKKDMLLTKIDLKDKLQSLMRTNQQEKELFQRLNIHVRMN